MRLITTTPNNLDTDEGLFCYSMIQSSIEFDEHWYDLPIEQVKEIIKEGSENDFVHIQFDYLELGHDEEWLKKQMRLVNNDLLKVKREIFLEWTYASDTSPFSEEQLTEIQKYVRKPIASFYIRKKYKFEIFEELYNLQNKNYIISIDIAGGLEKDSTVITVIDPLTCHPVCIFKSNKIDTVDLKDLVIDLVKMYFPEGVIVPERNSVGLSVVQMLLKSEVSRNVYYERKNTETEKTVDVKGKASKQTKEKRVYGLDTTAKTRDIMIKEILNMIVDEHPEYINNNYIFGELKTLERKKNNKIEHRDGMHDDCLMSYLIGMYALLYGNSINRFVKVIHNGNFIEADEDNMTNRNIIKTAGSIKYMNNVITHNVNNNIYRNIEKIKNDFEKRTQTIRNSENSGHRSSRNMKIKRRISSISNLNKR